MGYSCSALANMALHSLIDIMKGGTGSIGFDNEPSNIFNKYFYEIGKEQKDGAITGKVYKLTNNNTCLSRGSFKILPDGIIQRFPTSTQKQRQEATIQAVHRYIAQFQHWPKITDKTNHPAKYLLTASFVAV